MDDSPRAVSRSSTSFLTGTLLSRLSGLGRDMAMAFAFGSQPAIAAFMVAFRFANAIRRLFGEGNLPAGFIPHFEQLRARYCGEGRPFFPRSFLFFSLFFSGLDRSDYRSVLVLFWKWGHLSPDNAQILYLTILMMPGILFICLFGLTQRALPVREEVLFNWCCAGWVQYRLDPGCMVA